MVNHEILGDWYFERSLFKELEKWLDRKEILVIKGPRQAGKTTVLRILKDFLRQKRNIPENRMIFLTLEDRDLLEKMEKNPKDFIKSFIREEGAKYYFFLDEVQYLTECGQKLKLLFDLFTNIKFIVTGSSSLELTSQTGKYLVGRAFSFYLFPLNFTEFINIRNSQLANVFREKNKIVADFIFHDHDYETKDDIFISDFLKYYEEYAIFGGYPEVVKADNAEAKKIILKNLYETYLTKDIIEILRMKDVNQFRNLVRFSANQIGDMVNFNTISSDLGIYFQEVKRQFSVLEETYVASLIKPYSTNRVTELKKSPKVYFFDAGLRNFIINNYNPLDARMDAGKLAENFIFNQLRTRFPETEIRYWRTTGKAEVDFVFAADTQIIPIEIKFSTFKEEKISRSFRSFIETYAPQKALIATKNFWGREKIGKTIVQFVPLFYI